MMEVYASDQSLLHIGLERANTEQESDADGVIELLAAVDVLTRDWMKPLGVGFQLVYCDTSDYFAEVGHPPSKHHCLRQREVPDGVVVREAFSDSTDEDVPEITSDVISRAIARGLAQPAPSGAVTTLSELTWTAVQVLAPSTEPIALAVVGQPVATVSQLIDEQRWYFGPRLLGLAGPPARLRAVNDHYATRIQLHFFWDLWIGAPEGRALVEAGIARVLERPGWERTA